MASLSSSTETTFSSVKNVQWSNVSQIVAGSSNFVKCLYVLLCVGYLLSFSRTLLDLLAISPGRIVPPNFWIWTFVTYSFVEVHWWVVVWDVLAILLFSKNIEPVWTAIETLRFYAIVTTASALLSLLTYFSLYQPIQDTNLLFENHINGIAAFIAASTVAYRQLVPEAIVLNSPVARIRSRHLPGLLLVIVGVTCFLGLVEHSYVTVSFWGVIVSWVYLRFYQPHSGGTPGDFADSFSFASFFPDSIHPFVAILSNTVFAMLVAINVCKKVTKRYEVHQQPVIITLPGTDIHDAERRRQLALKALNERLSRVPAAQQWPSVDEPESSVSTTSSPVAQGGSVMSTQSTEDVASANNSDLLTEKGDSITQ